MNSPHLRRRYRAAGTRSGLIYLLGFVAAASLYVAQHVYTVRQQCRVEALRRDVETAQVDCERLKAVRDSQLSLEVIQPRAQTLGLEAPDLLQMVRLPLDAPVLEIPLKPAEPPAFAQIGQRVWQWLDPPSLSPNEVRAGQ
jgi:hypothetical protein